MNINQLHDRFLNDPVFNKLVMMMYVSCLNTGYTPQDLREVAFYAAVKYEMEHRSIFPFNPNENPLNP